MPDMPETLKSLKEKKPDKYKTELWLITWKDRTEAIVWYYVSMIQTKDFANEDLYWGAEDSKTPQEAVKKNTNNKGLTNLRRDEILKIRKLTKKEKINWHTANF